MASSSAAAGTAFDATAVELHALARLPAGEHPVRAVFDTSILIDKPYPDACTDALGPGCINHLLHEPWSAAHVAQLADCGHHRLRGGWGPLRLFAV